jgi:hypothetical protein
MSAGFISSLDELERLLDLLRKSGVKVFKLDTLQLVIGEEFEVVEEMEETESNPIGFATTDLRGLGIATDFDE